MSLGPEAELLQMHKAPRASTLPGHCLALQQGRNPMYPKGAWLSAGS